jgi:CheY-like chemotaxis protein
MRMSAFPWTQKIRVLLVDDCVAERDLYEIALSPEVDVRTATRGEEALILAERQSVDVIVLDLRMPGLDGWQVCEGLRRNPRTASIPVVLLTADDRPEVMARASHLGIGGLSKPCSADKLLSVIRVAHAHHTSPPSP